MKRDSDNKKHEFADKLLLILHGYLAVFLIAAITFLVFRFYDYEPLKVPQVRQYVLESTLSGFASEDSVKREGKERAAYLLSIILVPLVSFFSLLWLRRFSPLFCEKKCRFFYSNFSSFTACLILTPVLFVSLGWTVGNYPLFCPLILALLLSYGIVLYGCFEDEIASKKAAIFLMTASIILAVLIASYSLFGERDLAGYSMNFSPVANPLIQLFLGKALLIESKSHYGLYPYFLEPFLHLFGVSFWFVVGLFAALLLICLLSIAFCFFSIIRNKLLAFSGFVAFLYIQKIAKHPWPQPDAVIFQYQPIRLLFPSLLLSFFVFFFRNPTAKKYYSSLIFFSLATLWNLDVGFAVFGTLVFMLGYEKWFVSKSKNFSFKSVILHLLESFGILAAVWLMFFSFLYLRYGQLPHLDLLAYGQKAAFGFGYAMLPIEPISIWLVPILIYIASGLVAISNFLNKRFSAQNNFIVALTLLGIGLFTYFLCRSHGSNVMHCGYPALILLTIFADKFCAKFSRKNFISSIKKPRSKYIFGALPLFFVSYLAVLCFLKISNHALMEKYFISKRYFNVATSQKPYWMREVEFVKEHVGETKSARNDMLILIDGDDLDYYFALSLRAIFPTGVANMRHMFYVEEFDEICRLIETKQKRWVVFTESSDAQIISTLSRSEVERLKFLLHKNYKISAKSEFERSEKITIYSNQN